jgi:hypothetical protein
LNGGKEKMLMIVHANFIGFITPFLTEREKCDIIKVNIWIIEPNKPFACKAKGRRRIPCTESLIKKY